MKKILSIFAIAIIATMAIANSANAQNIAVVNVQEVLRQSSAAKGVSSQIEKLRSQYQAQVTKKEEELRASDQELAKQRATLSPEAFEQKRKEFRSKVTDTQRDVQNKRQALDRAFGEAMGEIQKSVLKIVEDLSKEKNFDVAIATSQLLYAKPNMDVTADVISRLNAALPSVNVKVDAAAKSPAPAKK